ncbi:MAG: hypothetical protein DRJ02_05055 [Bacteroidetes bacterium]|nr:MAG: hypothetical protein DRI87_01285 [Bacteroidota bacterium]RLD87998.1 MAG: hypothetical protein DRJ02_05055 [Bacteroidota bacterium]
MELSKILSISGRPGLYKMVGESKNGLIVESLDDGKKFPVFAHERISSLKEISIYTETDDISLRKVLKKMEEVLDRKPVDNPKKASGSELKSLFEQVIPDYDKEAVYVSDIKKVFTWYNLLLEKDMLDFPEEEDETGEEKTEENVQKTPDNKEKDD